MRVGRSGRGRGRGKLSYTLFFLLRKKKHSKLEKKNENLVKVVSRAPSKAFSYLGHL